MISFVSSIDNVVCKKEYAVIDSVDKLKELVLKFNNTSVIAFDIIASEFNYKSGIIEGLSFSLSKNTGWYIPLNENQLNKYELLEELKLIFENDQYFFAFRILSSIWVCFQIIILN